MFLEPIAVAAVGDNHLRAILGQSIQHWQTEEASRAEHRDHVARETAATARSWNTELCDSVFFISHLTKPPTNGRQHHVWQKTGQNLPLLCDELVPERTGEGRATSPVPLPCCAASHCFDDWCRPETCTKDALLAGSARSSDMFGCRLLQTPLTAKLTTAFPWKWHFQVCQKRKWKELCKIAELCLRGFLSHGKLIQQRCSGYLTLKWICQLR